MESKASYLSSLKSKAVTMLLIEKMLKKTSPLSLNASVVTNEVKRQNWQKWNDENKEAIDHYNARIQTEGLPLAQYRSF
jgi:antitoxin CcdA